jgi:hypothetical protein
MTVDYSATACIRCHQHDTGVLEIADGFIQHEDNYGDLFPGKHAILDCVTCHDPHAGVAQLREAGDETVRIACAECHFDQAEHFKLSPHPRECTTCHMPSLIQNATADPAVFTADMRTHMVAIDANQIEQFTDGELASTRLTLNSACRQCHAEGGAAAPRSDEELIQAANGIHAPAVEPQALPTPAGES